MNEIEFITLVITLLNTTMIFFMWCIDIKNEKFDSIEEDCIERDKAIYKIKEELLNIKERLIFLEAKKIYEIPTENVHINKRSEAAKEMWKRRRSKQIENKQQN